MKNIALLTYDLSIEYHISILDGILSYFKDKPDVSFFIAPVNVPHATTYECDYQYWTTTDVLCNKQIDAVIVLANSFSAYISSSRLAVELAKFGDKPIISIALPIDVPNNYYTYISSKQTYCQIVEHLIKKHNRKKIAFFSAELNGSEEAEERLRSYKAALKVNGLEYDPKLVFAGDYTPACTHGYIKQHYTCKEDVPYDALLCANDYMAIGAIGALEEIGAKVPEDVCVFGFDDADISTNWTPTASTVNQNLGESGRKAAELAYKAAYGKKIPKKNKIDCSPIYRQSCGCITGRERVDSYYDQTGTYFDRPNATKNVLNLFGNALDDMATIYHMLNMTDSVVDINDYFISLVKNLKKLNIPSMIVCLYNKEINLSPSDDFILPSKAHVLFHYDSAHQVEKNYYSSSKGVRFNPEQGLIPEKLGDFNPGNYFIFPLSLRNMNYGYFICQLPMNKYVVYEVFLKILGNSLIHSYVYSKHQEQENRLVESNQDLKYQSRTDELTKLLNRRGFMDYAQQLLELSNISDTKGCVFFFDLDNLKKINDKWGHKIGDAAIKTSAEVLKKAFRKSDLVGRLSGDEFAVIAPGFEKDKEKQLREKLKKLNLQYSEKKELPFTLSISLGCAEYDSSITDLQKLLLLADKELYKEKNIKHAKNNS